MKATIELRPKRYCHFDSRIPVTQNLRNYVSDPKRIATHSFYPFLQFPIATNKYSKGVKTSKTRNIYYSSHIDGYIFQYYAAVIKERYEAYLLERDLSQIVTAYRSLGKSNIHFADEAFNFIRENPNALALCFDVQGFFDNLDHVQLKRNLCTVLRKEILQSDEYQVFKNITRFSAVNRAQAMKQLNLKQKHLRNRNRLCTPKQFRDIVRDNGLIFTNRQSKGIPQGSAISAIYSNIYMIEFDQEMDTLSKSLGAFYRRYSDDIILIIPNPKKPAAYYEQLVKSITKSQQLDLSSGKTERDEFRDGNSQDKGPLQYLGFIFDGRNAYIRPKTISNYYRRLYNRIDSIKKYQAEKNNHKLYLKNFYRHYTHLGKRNFVSYAQRAKQIMKSDSVMRDVRRHWNKVNRRLK